MILVVDDDRDTLGLYKKCLEDSAIYVTNPQEAVRVLASGNVQLLITDYAMPFLDGIALAKIARGKYRIPVIIISAFKEHEKLMERNADAVFFKPFNFENLKTTILQILTKLLEDEKDKKRQD